MAKSSTPRPGGPYYFEGNLLDENALWAKWDALSPVQQQILRVFAYTWEPTYDYTTNRVIRAVYSHIKDNDIIEARRVLIRSGLLQYSSANRLQCQSALAHLLCEYEKVSGYPDQTLIVGALRVERMDFYWGGDSIQHQYRQMRLARYADNVEAFRAAVNELVELRMGQTYDHVLDFWLPEEGLEAAAARLSDPLLMALLEYRLDITALYMDMQEPWLGMYETLAARQGAYASQNVPMGILTIYLLSGRTDRLQAFIERVKPPFEQGILAMQRVFEGRFEEARTGFAQFTVSLRKETRNTRVVPAGLFGFLYALALLETRDPAQHKLIEQIVERNAKLSPVHQISFGYISGVLAYQRNQIKVARQLLGEVPSNGNDDILLYLEFQRVVCASLADPGFYSANATVQHALYVAQNGFRRLAAELVAAAREASDWDEQKHGPLVADISPLEPGEGPPLCHLFPRVAQWEYALQALQQIAVQGLPTERSTRIVWWINFEKGRLEAREQNLGKGGAWSKGRVVRPDRISGGQLESATSQDRSVAGILTNDYEWGYYERLPEEVLPALAGHPLLFLEKSPEVAVQLERREPVLLVRRTAGGYQLTFDPPLPAEGSAVRVVRESPTRYLLVTATDEQRRIAATLGPAAALHIPDAGAGRLKEVVSTLGGRTPVQSPFEDAGALDNLPERAADSRPVVHVLPVGDSFHVELFAKPFGDTPPYCRPGEGEPVLVAAVEGEKTRTVRDLNAEQKNAKALVKAMDSLREFKPHKGLWTLPGVEACLHFLGELQPLVQSGAARIEWPKGEKLRVTTLAGLDQLQLGIREQNHWFELEGSLTLDEGRVLRLQELLLLAEQQKSPFLELAPGRFLALTEALRRKLTEVAAAVQPTRRHEGPIHVHPLAASVLQPLIDAVPSAEVDQAFFACKKRLEEAFARRFEPPKRFNATLRPYQLEGFRWLHRMAAWGVGACLADDMGLGKTIQALALLTDRAGLGPALIVAPASVCNNWVDETLRFAPALRPVLFGEGDRERTLAELKKGDLLILTYDLMARERERIAARRWSTVVLDEAQAIKNRQTKRSETAMALQADFRLIMSGTPVENRLSELWNLFQFINPGLLGAEEAFNERFALPIEKYKDDLRRTQLHRLVSPFILRRRKGEVLPDLPPKTEITLRVPLSDAERSFYEALRRNALLKLEAEPGANPGEQQLKILAEIMRLRRAACHPRLADPNAAPAESAKLAAFAELVDELLQNGHKALVFSQFVGHLDILKHYLDEQQISYQYLDGQTPVATRSKRIKQFQNGEGELFLISLKAGGAGINLTAADYVIHMDPWWNPAVEDQATDRAHRIGQDKPVTVYRIVAENTIEEKIIRLHEQKRDLADALLAGTAGSARLSVEDLLALLQEK